MYAHMEILIIVHRELSCWDDLSVLSFLNNSFHCDNCLRLSWIKYYLSRIKKNLLEGEVGVTRFCREVTKTTTIHECPGIVSYVNLNFIEVAMGDKISRGEINRRWNDKVYAQWANAGYEGGSLYTVLYQVNDDDVTYRYIFTTYGYDATCPVCHERSNVELQEVQKFSTNKEMANSNLDEGMGCVYMTREDEKRFIERLKMIKGLHSVREAGYMRSYDDDDNVVFVTEISDDSQAVDDLLLVPKNGRLDSFIM